MCAQGATAVGDARHAIVHNFAGNSAHAIGKWFEEQDEWEKAVAWHQRDLDRFDEILLLHQQQQQHGVDGVEHADHVFDWQMANAPVVYADAN